jgi:hypothetical protein
MQLSTANACFRKLSDWVNSVSNFQASSRVMILKDLQNISNSCASFVLLQLIADEHLKLLKKES